MDVCRPKGKKDVSLCELKVVVGGVIRHEPHP